MAASILLLVWIHTNRAGVKQGYRRRIESWPRQNWICYAPTGYDPYRSLFPTAASITKDLALIKKAGFQGVVTYGSIGSLALIPAIAQGTELQVIQGVWEPGDRRELEAAIAMQHQVAGYCVGNEGLGSRYTFQELDAGVAYLANRVRLPVAVSEQVHIYHQHPKLIDLGDWLFPIVHPHFGNAKSPEAALEWVRRRTSELAALARARGSEKPLFIKEIGMPSHGDPEYSEIGQAQFLSRLVRDCDLHFVLFEAFDRKGWEYNSPIEPYWGVFRHDRSPKAVLTSVTGLAKTCSAEER